MEVLQEWVALLGALATEVRSKFAPSRFRYDPDSIYGGLTGVGLLSSKEGLFYFRDNRVILIHIHSKSMLTALNGDLLLEELGTPAAQLSSRAGKGHRQFVYPERGIAISSDSQGRIAFIEIFEPMSLDNYLARIYVDPGPFVK